MTQGSLPIARIKSAVAHRYGLTISQLDSPNKARSIAWPRQLAMTLAWDLTDSSLPQIGRQFGGRDHTTVVHARRCVSARVSELPEWAAARAEITAALQEQAIQTEESAIRRLKVDEALRAQVMGMLVKAAERGDRCPDNALITVAVGAESVSTATRILARLEKDGLIRVARNACGRVVTIVESGRSTAPVNAGRQHWSERGVHPQRKPLPPRVVDPSMAGGFRGDLPETRYVSRDPCFHCGVRGDIGCRHSRAQAREAAHV